VYYTTEFRKMAIMLGISPKNLDVFLKYLGGRQSDLCKQVMLFKPKLVDETCVRVPREHRSKESAINGSKQKEHLEVSKDEKKHWKGEKDKKTAAIAH